MKSSLFPELKAAADKKGMTLMEGKGETDKDTLGMKAVWVMDSDAYPFKQAEIYHQYHGNNNNNDNNYTNNDDDDIYI